MLLQKIIEGCLEERTMAGEIELSLAEFSDYPTGETELSEDQKGFLEAVNAGNYNKVREWAIPENIHTIPRTALRTSEGEGGFTIMEF